MPTDRRSPFASPSVRWFAAVTTSLALAVSAGCGDGATDPGQGEDEDQFTPTELVRLSWIGTFVGPGVGMAGYQTTQVDSARLSIRIDADSVRPADCPLCMTVALDTLFSLENVRIDDVAALDLEYVRDGMRWRLRVGRSSFGSDASATLFARPVEEGPTWVDMRYSLEPR